MVSKVCPSNKNRLIYLFGSNDESKYPTKIVIIITINMVWLWKNIICSMIGEAASCSPIWFQVAISKKDVNLIFGA